MTRVSYPRRKPDRSNGLLDAYVSWLDWNFKSILLWSLWFLFMGIWFAAPTIHAIRIGTRLSTFVIVPMAHSTSLTISLLGAIALAAISLLLGILLLGSCCALWCGWLKRIGRG
jgi:hypothetical protein